MQENKKKNVTRLRKYLIILLCIASFSFTMFYIILIDPLSLFDNNDRISNEVVILLPEEENNNDMKEAVVIKEENPLLLQDVLSEEVPAHGEHEIDATTIEYPVEEIYANIRILTRWSLEEYKKPSIQQQGYFPILAFAKKIQSLSLSSQEGLGVSSEQTIATMEVLRIVKEYIPVYIDSIILDNSGKSTQEEKNLLLTSLEHTGIQVGLILRQLNTISPNIMNQLTELARRNFIIFTLEKELEKINQVIASLIKVGKNEDLSSLAEKKHELTKKIRAEKQFENENENLLSFLYTAEEMGAFPISMVKEVIALIIEYASSSSPQPFIHTLQSILLEMKNSIESKRDKNSIL